MSYIKIGNKAITTSVQSILYQLQKETNRKYFKDIKYKGNQLCITCPVHKGGQENNPSCFITDDQTSDMNGIWHCFTCGASGTLLDLVSHCFDNDIILASEWLTERYGETLVVQDILLPEITLENEKKHYLDESILDEYNYFHPYMFQRGLTEEVIRKFKVGCTPDGKYLTFPCWNEHGNLIGIFKRSTTGKHFIIPKDIDKPIYLLNFIMQEHITTAVVTEGPIDALISWKYNYPAIALFGAGTTANQLDILNRSGIFHFILMYDNDIAGRKGAEKFKKYIRQDKLITDIIMPPGKDVASCSEQEFTNIILNNV